MEKETVEEIKIDRSELYIKALDCIGLLEDKIKELESELELLRNK